MPDTSSRAAWASALLATAVAGGLLTAGPAVALNGSEVPNTAFGFAAKLNIGERAACSGSLVAPQWVLTAKSCFSEGGAPVTAGKPAVTTTVTVGRTDLTQRTGTVVEAAELVPHADRDLVMVKLAWRVVGTTPVAVASTAPTAGEQLTSLGFGRTKTEWVPTKAHSANFTVAAVDGGSVSLNGAGDDVLCKGDAGAPALRQKGAGVELVAVNSRSWQGGCLGTAATETRKGAVDVRVDDLGSWVNQVAASVPEVRLQSLVPRTSAVMTTGDFNGDGRSDVVAVTTDGNLHAYSGRPDGKFEYGRSLWRADGSWGGATKIVGGDFNGDGLTDIAAAWASGALRLYAGLSDGTLADGKGMWIDENTNWNGMLHLARYRADNSGRDSLLTVWGGGPKGAVYVYSTGTNGLLNGQSRKLTDTLLDTAQKVTSGDFNGDGRDDVVVLAADGALLRYNGNATNGLDAPVSMWHDKGWGTMPVVLSGDFDGDGKADLGGMWSNQQRFNFYQGNGQGAVAEGLNAWPSPVPLPASGQLRNLNSGKCLEIVNSSKDNGALAQQWTCGSQAGVVWQFRPTTTAGVYEIVNANSGKCLEIRNSSKDNGGPAQQWTCTGINTQRWTVQAVGSTVSLNLVNVNSGKVLEISNSSKDNGGTAQQWASAGVASQAWYV
ncbi:RICIN domain-containing protein [Streptomyces sp. NPDC004290]